MNHLQVYHCRSLNIFDGFESYAWHYDDSRCFIVCLNFLCFLFPSASRASTQTLSSYSWHPSLENAMLTISSNGKKDFIKTIYTYVYNDLKVMENRLIVHAFKDSELRITLGLVLANIWSKPSPIPLTSDYFKRYFLAPLPMLKSSAGVVMCLSVLLIIQTTFINCCFLSFLSPRGSKVDR